MKFSQLAAVAALTASSSTFAQEEPVRCSLPPADSELSRVLGQAAQPIPQDPNAPRRVLDTIPVDTYVHVVTGEAQAGQYTQAMIDEQMRVMDDSYRAFGFSFNTLNVTFTVNNAWAAIGQRTQAERDMKAALRQGGYDSLNLYFVGQTTPANILGWCYFPTTSLTELTRTLDGCINLAGSLPGGGTRNYELGYTAVHEVGHWFGLFHVFQGAGACGSGPGDSVDDTPPQWNATRGCPRNNRPDSCPEPGLDSIFNFMDYSYDECLDQFTPGQMSRGKNIYNDLRAGAIRFTEPESLGNAAIISPRTSCNDESTYMGVRRWSDGAFDIERCAQHCREQNQYNTRNGQPQICRFFNTYIQRRDGEAEFQACSLYTQKWGSEFATNTGQFQGTERVTISDSFSATDVDNDGVPFECT